MARWYYLGGQRIDPVRPVVRWLIDVERFFCVRETSSPSVGGRYDSGGAEPRTSGSGTEIGKPLVDDVLANGQSFAGIAMFLQDQTVGKPR